MNRKIDSDFETKTHCLGQTKGHSKMVKEWMPQPIPTKDNVNPDSMNIQQQQMAFNNRNNYTTSSRNKYIISSRNNYITSQEKQIHRTPDPKVVASTTDDLCECIIISYLVCNTD